MFIVIISMINMNDNNNNKIINTNTNNNNYYYSYKREKFWFKGLLNFYKTECEGDKNTTFADTQNVLVVKVRLLSWVVKGEMSHHQQKQNRTWQKLDTNELCW